MIGLKGIAKRAVFVIDKDGVVRHREVLDDARNEPDYDKVFGACKEPVGARGPGQLGLDPGDWGPSPAPISPALYMQTYEQMLICSQVPSDEAQPLERRVGGRRWPRPSGPLGDLTRVRMLDALGALELCVQRSGRLASTSPNRRCPTSCVCCGTCAWCARAATAAWSSTRSTTSTSSASSSRGSSTWRSARAGTACRAVPRRLGTALSSEGPCSVGATGSGAKAGGPR